MADLRQSLYALVEHPPATPVPIEVVAARGARFGRRRRVLYRMAGLVLVAVASAAGLALTLQDSESGIVLATSGPRSAGYIAERPGGYAAAGAWSVTITRGSQVIELSSATSHRCGPIGVIQPGDEVRGSITGRDSTLRVGERFSCPEE